MFWLVAVFVFLVVLGGMLPLLPSRRERRKVRLRQEALRVGFKFRSVASLLPDACAYDSSYMYYYRLLPPENSLGYGKCLLIDSVGQVNKIRSYGYSNDVASRIANYIKFNNAGQCDWLIVSNQVGVIWNEVVGREELLRTNEQLEAIIGMLSEDE